MMSRKDKMFRRMEWNMVSLRSSAIFKKNADSESRYLQTKTEVGGIGAGVR